MNASENTRRPTNKALILLTLSVLTGQFPSAAHAAEKELPPKVRDSNAPKKESAEKADPTEKKTGPRDGDNPRTGPRDGEGMKKAAERDAEGGKPSAEAALRSPKGRETSDIPATGELITLKIINGGETVLIGDEKVPMHRLRGFLSTFLPNHLGARVEVVGTDDTPLNTLHGAIDAVRDNGNKNVSLKAK